MSKLKRIVTKEGKVNWSCLKKECPKSCCGPFMGASTELSSVTNISSQEIPLTPEDLNRIIENYNDKNIKTLEDGKFLMLESDGSCKYLENGLCSIYDSRPFLCRAYPFCYDFSMGLCIDSRCPGIDKGFTEIEKITECINSLSRLYEHHLTKGIEWVKKTNLCQRAEK